VSINGEEFYLLLKNLKYLCPNITNKNLFTLKYIDALTVSIHGIISYEQERSADALFSHTKK